MTTSVPENFYQTCKPRLQRRIARELRSARRVVDIGCGDCELAGLLAQADSREVVGVDIRDGNFPDQPDPARHRRCVKADARRLDFLTKGTVDAVVSVWALHELAAPMAVLREARRILRPGGEILVVDFPRRSLAQRLWDEDYYTTGEIANLLKRVGFVRVQARRIARKQLTWARGFKAVRRGGHR
ncbi:MAG: class I SAM-dependent methyltransferase [bacterium]